MSVVFFGSKRDREDDEPPDGGAAEADAVQMNVDTPPDAGAVAARKTVTPVKPLDEDSFKSLTKDLGTYASASGTKWYKEGIYNAFSAVAPKLLQNVEAGTRAKFDKLVTSVPALNDRLEVLAVVAFLINDMLENNPLTSNGQAPKTKQSEFTKTDMVNRLDTWVGDSSPRPEKLRAHVFNNSGNAKYQELIETHEEVKRGFEILKSRVVLKLSEQAKSMLATALGNVVNEKSSNLEEKVKFWILKSVAYYNVMTWVELQERGVVEQVTNAGPDELPNVWNDYLLANYDVNRFMLSLPVEIAKLTGSYPSEMYKPALDQVENPSGPLTPYLTLCEELKQEIQDTITKVDAANAKHKAEAAASSPVNDGASAGTSTLAAEGPSPVPRQPARVPSAKRAKTIQVPTNYVDFAKEQFGDKKDCVLRLVRTAQMATDPLCKRGSDLKETSLKNAYATLVSLWEKVTGETVAIDAVTSSKKFSVDQAYKLLPFVYVSILMWEASVYQETNGRTSPPPVSDGETMPSRTRDFYLDFWKQVFFDDEEPRVSRFEDVRVELNKLKEKKMYSATVVVDGETTTLQPKGNVPAKLCDALAAGGVQIDDGGDDDVPEDTSEQGDGKSLPDPLDVSENYAIPQFGNLHDCVFMLVRYAQAKVDRSYYLVPRYTTDGQPSPYFGLSPRAAGLAYLSLVRLWERLTGTTANKHVLLIEGTQPTADEVRLMKSLQLAAYVCIRKWEAAVTRDVNPEPILVTSNNKRKGFDTGVPSAAQDKQGFWDRVFFAPKDGAYKKSFGENFGVARVDSLDEGYLMNELEAVGSWDGTHMYTEGAISTDETVGPTLETPYLPLSLYNQLQAKGIQVTLNNTESPFIPANTKDFFYGKAKGGTRSMKDIFEEAKQRSTDISSAVGVKLDALEKQARAELARIREDSQSAPEVKLALSKDKPFVSVLDETKAIAVFEKLVPPAGDGKRQRRKFITRFLSLCSITKDRLVPFMQSVFGDDLTEIDVKSFDLQKMYAIKLDTARSRLRSFATEVYNRMPADHPLRAGMKLYFKGIVAERVVNRATSYRAYDDPMEFLRKASNFMTISEPRLRQCLEYYQLQQACEATQRLLYNSNPQYVKTDPMTMTATEGGGKQPTPAQSRAFEQAQSKRSNDNRICLYNWATGTGKTTAMWAEVLGGMCNPEPADAFLFAVLRPGTVNEFVTAGVDPEDQIHNLMKSNSITEFRIAVTFVISKQKTNCKTCKTEDCWAMGKKTREDFVSKQSSGMRAAFVDVSFTKDGQQRMATVVLMNYFMLYALGTVMTVPEVTKQQPGAPVTPSKLKPFGKFMADNDYLCVLTLQTLVVAKVLVCGFDEAHELRNQSVHELEEHGGDGVSVSTNTVALPAPFQYMHNSVLWFCRFIRQVDARQSARVALFTATPVGQRVEQLIYMFEAAAYLTSSAGPSARQALLAAANARREETISVLNQTTEIFKKMTADDLTSSLVDFKRDANPRDRMLYTFEVVGAYLRSIGCVVSLDMIDESTMPRRNYLQSQFGLAAGGLCVKSGRPWRVQLGPAGVQLQKSLLLDENASPKRVITVTEDDATLREADRVTFEQNNPFVDLGNVVDAAQAVANTKSQPIADEGEGANKYLAARRLCGGYYVYKHGNWEVPLPAALTIKAWDTVKQDMNEEPVKLFQKRVFNLLNNDAFTETDTELRKSARQAAKIETIEQQLLKKLSAPNTFGRNTDNGKAIRGIYYFLRTVIKPYQNVAEMPEHALGDEDMQLPLKWLIAVRDRFVLKSEKLDVVATNVVAHRGSPTVVFCEFSGLGGSDHLALLLKQRGWHQIDNVDENSQDIRNPAYDYRRFFVFKAEDEGTDGFSTRDRTNIFKENSVFNGDDNADGSRIACVILLKAGHVSLTIRNVLSAHFLHPMDDCGRGVQCLGRIARRGTIQWDKDTQRWHGKQYGFSALAHKLLDSTEVTDTTLTRFPEINFGKMMSNFLWESHRAVKDQNPDTEESDWPNNFESLSIVGAPPLSQQEMQKLNEKTIVFKRAPVVSYTSYAAYIEGGKNEWTETGDEHYFETIATKMRVMNVLMFALVYNSPDKKETSLEKPTQGLISYLRREDKVDDVKPMRQFNIQKPFVEYDG